MIPLNEKIYVWFGKRRYVVTRERFFILVQNAVKGAMPEGFKTNFIFTSKTTESQYFSVFNQNKAYYFRISSHHNKRKEYNVKSFLTSDYENFKDLGNSIRSYFEEEEDFVRLNINHFLFLNFLKNSSDKGFSAEYKRKLLIVFNHEKSILFNLSKRSEKIIRSMVRFGFIDYESEENIIKTTRATTALLQRATSILPSEELVYFKDQKISLEESFQIANDLDFRIDWKKQSMIKVLNDKFPENVIKGHVENNGNVYSWFIPKRLRGKIKIGDKVKVANRNKPVIVDSLYIEGEKNIESMEPVYKIL